VVFDKASKWLERYRIQAEKRYHRLESVLADRADQNDPPVKGQGK
jgi:hypothetical protein